MRCFLLVVMGCVGFASSVHATTSCNPKITFLGFSADNNALYYEVSGGGECMPFKVMVQVDVQSKKTQDVVSVDSDEGSSWQKKFAQQKSKWLSDHSAIVNKPASRALPKSCPLGSPIMESEREVGMHEKPKNIKQVYHNIGNPSLWVVISAHCHEASWAGYNDRTCPTIDHLSVYQAEKCVP